MVFEQNSAKVAAYFSAAFTFVSAALISRTIVLANKEWDKYDNCDYESFKRLEPECVDAQFKVDNSIRWYVFSINILVAIAPLLLLPLVLSYNEVLTKLTRLSASKVMVPAFTAAAAIQVLQAASEAGLHTFADYVEREFTLNDDNLIALMLAYRVARSMFLWLFALDQLFLGIGMAALSRMIRACNDLPNGLCYLGWVVALLSLVNFCLELARFADWSLMSAVGGISILATSFVLLPAWLIWAACCLNRFKHYADDRSHNLMPDSDGGGIQLGAVAQAGSDSDAGDTHRI